MDALNLMATLGLDSKDYEKGLDDAKGAAKGFASSLTGIIKGTAKAFGAIAAAGSAAIVGLVKQAVDAYAEYEQLAGGVDTLFGNGGKSLEQYAASASTSLYKMGQRGDDIRQLQEELIAAGYDIGETGADGIYGPKTQAAFDAYARAGGQMVQDMYDQSNAAAEIVKNNADRAYMTAGMSANEYMNTVTSFSASLIQSLGGDTMRAAELSDMAIIDMADNVNKMGTSMESVQNAYAGFAKGNYTMLDNLRLGYGGTRSEMERLIADANRMREAQGLNGDLTIESYADIVEAIHTVQTEMGISGLTAEQAAQAVADGLMTEEEAYAAMGTTAKEAQTTIQGSLFQTKAAWKNLILALASGKDLKKVIKNFTDSAKTYIKNIIPVAKQALVGIADFVTEIAPIIIDELPGLISEIFPALLTGVGTLITSIAKTIPSFFKGMGSAIKQMITGDTDASWPEVATAIYNGIKDKFSEGLASIKEALGISEDASWPEVANAIGQGIRDAFSTGLDSIKALMGITSTGEESWNEVGKAIENGITAVFETGMTFIKGLLGLDATATWEEVGTALKNGVVSAFRGGMAALKGLIGLDNSASWPEVASAIGNGIRNMFTDGVSFIKGALGIDDDGLSWTEVGSAIHNGISAILSAGVSFIKSLLGIDGKPWTEVGDSIIDGISQAFNEIPKKGADFIMGLLFGSDNDSPLQSAAEAQGEAIGGTISDAVYEQVGDTTRVEERASALVSAVQPVIDIATGNYGVGENGESRGINGTLADIVYEKIGNPKATEERGGLLRDAFEGIFTAIEVAFGIAATAKVATTIGTFFSTAFGTLSGWVTKIGTLISSHPYIAFLIGTLVASKKIDEAYIDRTYGDYFDAHDKYAELMTPTNDEHVTAMQGRLSQIEYFANDDNFETAADQAEQFWAALGDSSTGLWDNIVDVMPENEIVQQIQSAFADGFSWEDLMNGNAQGVDWDKLAADAYTAMSSEVETALSESSETGLTNGGETGSTALLMALGNVGLSEAITKEVEDGFNNVNIPSFNVPVTLNTGGGADKHASGMDSGEILHGLTPFGIGPDGVVHYGGDAGPEAVVGVNSLNEMIQRSVNAAMANVQSMRQPINVQLLLDSGELLAAVDVGLNDRANWRGGGRA